MSERFVLVFGASDRPYAVLDTISGEQATITWPADSASGRWPSEDFAQCSGHANPDWALGKTE